MALCPFLVSKSEREAAASAGCLIWLSFSEDVEILPEIPKTLLKAEALMMKASLATPSMV